MPKVEILRPGAKMNRKPIGEVGDVVDVDATLASAMVSFNMAKYVEDEKPADEKPETADERETATDPNADERETREVSAKAIRTWAQDNDIDVPARGAIPAEVREKFNAAHADN